MLVAYLVRDGGESCEVVRCCSGLTLAVLSTMVEMLVLCIEELLLLGFARPVQGFSSSDNVTL